MNLYDLKGVASTYTQMSHDLDEAVLTPTDLEHLKFIDVLDQPGKGTQVQRGVHPENQKAHDKLVKAGLVSVDDQGNSHLTDAGQEALEDVPEAEKSQPHTGHRTKSWLAKKVAELANAEALYKDGKRVLRREFMKQLEAFLESYKTEA